MTYIDKILGIASDFGCDVEGFRPHLEQILNGMHTQITELRQENDEMKDAINTLLRYARGE